VKCPLEQTFQFHSTQPFAREKFYWVRCPPDAIEDIYDWYESISIWLSIDVYIYAYVGKCKFWTWAFSSENTFQLLGLVAEVFGC